MAYTNKVTEVAVAITVVLFLAVAIAPQCTEAELDGICAIAIPEIVKHCYVTTNLSPSEECCDDLKTANKREVTCLCDHFIANPSNANFTRALYDEVNTACGVLDKLACKGGDAKGEATKKIAGSISLFGLVASLIFLVH